MMICGCMEFKDRLQQIQLLPAILAVRQGVRANVNNFLGMLEQYSSETCTFFTPAGEIGISPWEMQHVSGLFAGEFPYEEHVPPSAELELLKMQDPELYSTYWEVLCHFFICGESKSRGRGGVVFSTWAEYLFPGIAADQVEEYTVLSELEARQLALESKVTLKEPVAGSSSGAPPRNFCYFGRRPMTSRARLAGFLSIWLGKCVVPTREAATVGVILPVARLACGVRIALVPAIIANIQHGLREVSTAFLANPSTPPRARLAYTYLVAWYVLHCPALMTPTPSLDLATPFIGSVAECSWTLSQRPEIRQLLSRPENYQLYRCPPLFDKTVDGGSFVDLAGEGGSTVLAPGPFTWLLNIRPGYHLFRREMECWIEPYTPSRFARQSGYDQLYVGNPNSDLAAQGTLLEGARAWFYSIAGGTAVTFSLPSSQPKLLWSLNFGCWFLAATIVGTPPSFLPNLGEDGTDMSMEHPRLTPRP